MYVNIESKIKAILSKLDLDTGSVHSHPSNESTSNARASAVRLPKIELKHLNGDPQSWMSFINLFDTTIHTNSSLPKFQYWLGSDYFEEIKPNGGLTMLTAVSEEVSLSILHKFSSRRKMVRVLAFVLRFIAKNRSSVKA